MVDLLHVSFFSKIHFEGQNNFLFEKDIEFLLFSFELCLLKVVLFFSYEKNLCDLVFFELNLSFYLSNHFGFDEFFFSR